MTVFISPHNDDETLFGAFTLLREKPLVVVVLDSYVQAARGYGITAEQRRVETRNACAVLGVGVDFWHVHDDQPDWRVIESSIRHYAGAEVYAPAVEENGHDQHNRIGELARKHCPNLTQYMTYTRTGGKSKGKRVPYENEWIGRKMQALACYKSQIAHPSTAEHFIRDQFEYYLE